MTIHKAISLGIVGVLLLATACIEEPDSTNQQDAILEKLESIEERMDRLEENPASFTVRSEQFEVEGSAMEPNFSPGTVVELESVDSSGLERGDVIVFQFPRDLSRKFIKRIAALPGDTIEIRKGVVYVGGQESQELEGIRRDKYSMESISMGLNEFFVLGDNRRASNDSRDWGSVNANLIIGRVRGALSTPQSRSGTSESSVSRPIETPNLTPLPGVRIAELGRTHISPEQDHPPYNSVPATSGWHYGQPLAPTRWGIHEEVIPDEVLVHNLEHGGVGLFYNCPDGCDGLIMQLSELVEEYLGDGEKVLIAPLSPPPLDTNLSQRIYLAAWTYLAEFDEYDEPKIRDFIDAHESSSNSPEPSAR